MDNAMDDAFLFLPLGGVGEIGMNLALYGYGPEESREWIIVDMGVSFAGPQDAGADLIIPDISFLENERHNIKAILLTHAHEDHYGAVLYLAKQFQWPIYCTNFTAHLLEAKRVGDHFSDPLIVNVFQAGDILKIGSFSIDTIQVNHSIPNAVSFAITTKLGTAVHTGDWKIDSRPILDDPTDMEHFKTIGKKGVLALICDSTNAMKEGHDVSEQDVKENLTSIIAAQQGAVAITTFSSNIGRIRSIALAAQEAGRKVFLLGRSMKRSVTIAQELGYMEGLEPFLSEEDYSTVPRKKKVIILTGSQGEQRAALAKISKNEMHHFALFAGDTVIYSARTIPGNEREVLNTQNRLADLGLHIIDNNENFVHVSGHPYRKDLAQLYKNLSPQILIPVHGEALHLNAHADFAREQGIKHVLSIRNGDMVQLAPKKPAIVDEIPVGRLFKDGKLIGTEPNLGMVERRKLHHVGHVSVFIAFDTKQQRLSELDLVSYGLPKFDEDGETIESILLDHIEDGILNLPKTKRKDLRLIQDVVRRLIRSKMGEIWGKKPFITVFVR